MIRSRLLSLAVVSLAFAALGALPAAASAAAGFVAGNYPAAVEGGEAKLALHFEAVGTVFCNKAPHLEALAEGPSRSLNTSSVGNGSECGGSGTLKMNGCKFAFNRDTNTADIVPAGCGSIEAPTGGYCGNVKIYPKGGLTATYANVGSGSTASVKIGLEAKKLKYQVTEGSCKHGTFYDGEIYTQLEAPWVVRAYQAVTKTPPYVLGEQVGISTVSELSTVGIFMDAKGLDASKFPVSVEAEAEAGESSTFQLLRNGGTAEKWTLQCRLATVGGGPLSAPLAQPSLTGFSGCTVGGIETVVTMNSCRYLLGSATEVACNTGDSIKVAIGVNTGITCTLSIPAQVINVGAPAFTNYGEGSSANVTAHMTGSGEDYTSTGGFLCEVLGVKSSETEATTDAHLRMRGYAW